MKNGPVLLIATTVISVACTGASSSQNATMMNDYAKRIWQQNMAIVDRSVEFWKKKQSGTAPYRSEELTSAIDFFETLTQIKGANLSFLGPIPDEQLETASIKWKAWYALHGDHLTYDTPKRRVIISK
jgi:hypothetical protein